MKSIIVFAAFALVALFPSSLLRAQGNAAGDASLENILARYYEVKDALVGSDATAAAAKSAELLKSISGVDTRSLSPAGQKAFTPLQDKLAFDARHISESKEIAHQREHFTSLSANMVKLAKSVKLSTQTVYQDYCPMKKAVWLSNESVIKNPYYGKAMLNCGKVEQTIQ